MLTRKTGTAVALATMFTIAGSAFDSASAQSEAAQLAHAENADVSVKVDNFNSHDVEIHVITEKGGKVRLGSVSAEGDRTFRLSDRLPDGNSEFRLMISCMWPDDPRSAVTHYHEAVETRPLLPQPGAVIEISVLEPLRETIVAFSGS